MVAVKRRTFLLASIAGLAGCSTGGSRDSQPESTPIDVSGRNTATEYGPPTQTETATETSTRTPVRTETETQTTTATETPTPTQTSTPQPGALEIVETTLRDSTSRYGPEKYAQIDLANPTGNPHGYAEIHAAFRDAQGNTIDSERENTIAIPGGETWRAYLGYNEEQPIDSVETKIVDPSPVLEISPPTGAEVTSSGNVSTSFGNPEVSGKIKISKAFDYLEVLAPFYDTDGYLRGVGRANESYLEAGTTWSFTAEDVLNPPDFAAGLTDYELILTTD